MRAEWKNAEWFPTLCFINSRMVNLPKNKVDQGILRGDDIRPITILNVFWRIWGVAWLQTVQVQRWISSLPKEICYGKGSNSGLAVGENFSTLLSKGYGGTLDYTKAYDSMNVQGTVLLLKRAGWPSGIVDVVGSLWSRQVRWVVWEGHVDQVPLMASCAPQGCYCFDVIYGRGYVFCPGSGR